MTDTQFNTQPQPRTFAPSKEDVMQNLQYFFGAPVSPEKLKDYSEHHATTCALAFKPAHPRPFSGSMKQLHLGVLAQLTFDQQWLIRDYARNVAA